MEASPNREGEAPVGVRFGRSGIVSAETWAGVAAGALEEESDMMGELAVTPF